jgi:hypothetical protein
MAGGVAAFAATLLLAGLLLSRLHQVKVDGTLQVNASSRGDEGRLAVGAGRKIPPLLADVISCGVDGQCRLHALIVFPAGFDAAPLSGRPTTLLHSEFSLPGLERYGATARNWQVDGTEVFRKPTWPVFVAYGAVSAAPLLAWAVVAGLGFAWRGLVVKTP